MIMSNEKINNVYPQVHYIERAPAGRSVDEKFEEDLGTDYLGNVLFDVTEFAKTLPKQWFYKLGKLSFAQFIEFVMHWTSNTGEEATFFRDSVHCKCQLDNEHSLKDCLCYRRSDDLHHLHFQSLNRYNDFVSFFRDNLPLPFDSTYGESHVPLYASLDLHWPKRAARLEDDNRFFNDFRTLKESKECEATRNAKVFRLWVKEHTPESQALVNAIEAKKREDAAHMPSLKLKDPQSKIVTPGDRARDAKRKSKQ